MDPFASVLCLINLLVFPTVANSQTKPNTNQAELNELLAQGLKLRQTGTRESLEASISKFGEALKIIRLLQDPPLEANILFIVGSTYNQLGESQKALGSYLDALALFRT